jgi:DNA-binding response OmpR family regulator
MGMATGKLPTVLVVEDERLLRETLEYNLAKQGYRVVSAADGVTAMQLARLARPDAILLDVMLPGIDGLDVCRTLRGEMNVPILMLTARSDEADKVVGLEMGADDYVTKPFSMRELMARVKALLRRGQGGPLSVSANETQEGGDCLVAGDLEIDIARHEVRRNGQPLRLNPKEYDLLVYAVRNRGIGLSRDMILEKVWGWDFAGGTRTVDVHVRWLREKIEPDPSAPARLVTIRGVGYRFEG